MALAGIGTAVVLYPVVKRQNEAVALGFVSARVLEAATIFVGVASLLVVVTLRQAGAGPDALVTDQALVALYDRMFLLGQSLIPVVNALLLYRSRLVPRVLPVVGFVGAALLLASAKCPVNGPRVAARAGVSQGGRIGSVLLVDYAHSATGEGGNTTGKHWLRASTAWVLLEERSVYARPRDDGAAVARRLVEQVSQRAAACSKAVERPPRLATVLIGDDPASHTYVRMKVSRCRTAGIDSVRQDLPTATSTEEAVDLVGRLSSDPSVDGILVQHPMPDHVDEYRMFEAVAPGKDVGVTGGSFVAMSMGRPGFASCTQLGSWRCSTPTRYRSPGNTPPAERGPLGMVSRFSPTGRRPKRSRLAAPRPSGVAELTSPPGPSSTGRRPDQPRCSSRRGCPRTM